MCVTAVFNQIIIDSSNAAHRAARARRTAIDAAVIANVAAHRAGIGALIQGTVVLACDAAQICIFIKIFVRFSRTSVLLTVSRGMPSRPA